MVNDKTLGPLLTVKDVARILHIHTNTVRRWSDRGLIRAYRISSRGDRRFKKEDIAHFLAELNTHKGNEKEVNLTSSR
jgi:excisionase family DNA binding protein